MKFTVKEIEAKCQENIWLKTGGVEFEDDPYMELDYPFGVFNCESLKQLEQKLGQGGWAIRSCFAYDRLAFVNQVNGGDEWLAIYKHDDGRLEDFESITFGGIIRDGEFEEYFARLSEGPDKYWERGEYANEAV